MATTSFNVPRVTRRGEKGGDKKPVKSDQSVINGLFRMGSQSHSLTMSGKKLKRLGDAQRKQKQNEITTTMTLKFLVRLITKLSTRLPELSTSRLGIKFKRILGKTTKAQPPTLESCTLLMRELHMSDESYSVTTTLSPNKIAVL